MGLPFLAARFRSVMGLGATRRDDVLVLEWPVFDVDVREGILINFGRMSWDGGGGEQDEESKTESREKVRAGSGVWIWEGCKRYWPSVEVEQVDACAETMLS